mgnify:CR=1 FL=1|nr:MAG TPA: hypothetical protein [Caudoviricetes sp.]
MRGDQLILIASIITAITIIVTATFKVLKMFTTLYNKIHEFQESINENTMYTLKLVVLNENLDMEERISAGKRYLELGGNGFVHAVYNKLLEEEEQENDERADKSIN